MLSNQLQIAREESHAPAPAPHLADWLEENGEPVPIELLRRRDELYRATASGMTDNLLWPDAAGEALRIRSNFVLLPTKGILSGRSEPQPVFSRFGHTVRSWP